MSRGFGPTLGTGTNIDLITSQSVAGTLAQRSYSMWVYVNGKGGVNFGIFFIQGTSGNDFLQCNNSTGNLVFKSRFTTVTGQWVFNCAAQGNWQHIGITYDASSTSNIPTVYINGVATSVTLETSPVGTNNPVASSFYVGLNPPSNNGYFDGMQSDFAFWNGVILNAGAMAALSRGVSPLSIGPFGPSLYLPLDGVNNPEPDAINGTSLAISGTRLGTSEPPAQKLTSFYRTFIDSAFIGAVSATIAAYQQADRAGISADEAITIALSAWQQNNYANLSLSELIAVGIAAFQRVDSAALSLSEVIAAALAAAQGVDFGALTVTEIIGAALDARQSVNFSSISDQEIIQAVINAFQRRDRARIIIPSSTMLGQASVTAQQAYSAGLKEASVYNASLQSSQLYQASVSATI